MGLPAVIEKALEFEPQNRYQSCADMKEALDDVRYGLVAAPQRAATWSLHKW